MEYQLVRPNKEMIIDYCNDLEADEVLVVFEYGNECDLVLYITKDPSYKSGDDWNLVDIETYKDGVAVDDATSVYVTDGELYRELERIAEYREFSTL